MNTGHYIERCKFCNKVMSQCRCIDCNKQVIYSVCTRCSELKDNEERKCVEC